jgi:hypothetical protein
MVYLSYCFSHINGEMLVVKFHSSSAVPGFSRNEFNSYVFLNFYCLFIFIWRQDYGIGSLFYFYDFLNLVLWILQ